MSSELARNYLKQKYGKGISNITSEKYKTKDREKVKERSDTESYELLKHIRKLKKSKDVPQKAINARLKELAKKSKKYKDE